MCLIMNRSWFFRLIEWLTNKPWKEMSYYTSFGLLFDDKIWNDETYCRKKYDEWIFSVKENVPKDKLLVFNVAQGWEPLCSFLDKEIPEDVEDPKEFVTSNYTANMLKIYGRQKTVRLVTDLALIGSVIAVSFVLYRKFKLL